MPTDPNQQYTSIMEAIESFRLDPSLDRTPELAEKVNTILLEMIQTVGLDHPDVEEASTEIGKCLLAAVVRAVNGTCQNLSPRDTDKYKLTLKNAEEVMAYISKLPISHEFRDQRLVPQQSKLTCIIDKISTITAGHHTKTISWDAEKGAPAEEYKIKKMTDRKTSIMIYVSIVVALGLGMYVFDVVKEWLELRKIKNHYTEEAISDYLSTRGNTHFVDDALILYLANMDSILLDSATLSQPTQFPPLTRMYNLAHSGMLPTRISEEIDLRVRQRTDSLYALANIKGDLKSWYFYQSQAPTNLYYDSSQRIDSLEQEAWSTEPTAWEAACTANNKQAFQRYIDGYPNGEHAKQADGCLIDIEVNDYRNRGRSSIKEIDFVAPNSLSGSRVNIFNDSDYDLEILLSGTESKRLRIPMKGVGSTDIADGEYKILIKASGERNAKFSFSQTFEHGLYSCTLSTREKETQ